MLFCLTASRRIQNTMWSIARLILMVLALAGFIGQTSVRAMPMTPDAPPAAAPLSMMDCADMPGMGEAPMAMDVGKAQTPAKTPAPAPCKKMTPDCIGKMGCGTAAIPPPATLAFAAIAHFADVSFQIAERDHDGLDPSPPFIPPISLA